jgi:hypothetical protein
MNSLKTIKNDWFNEYLAAYGYLVSGHQSFANALQIPQQIASIRHFRLKKSNFPDLFLLTIECADEIPIISTAHKNNVFARIKQTFPNIQLLSIGAGARFFSINGDPVIDGNGLLSWFSKVNSEFTLNTGGVKPVNVSSNDAFSDWTRYNLTNNCVINDIDAIYLPTDLALQGVLIEGKRPKSDLSKWGPYLNDQGNYDSSVKIAARCNLQNRTIASVDPFPHNLHL